jgi:preprotein translocase subunit SecG
MVIITILIFIVAILLGVIVLIQNPKGGGLGSAFGNANQLGGVKRTADFLEKATWGLALCLVLLCLGSSFILSSSNPSLSAGDDKAGEAEMSAPQIDPGVTLDLNDMDDLDSQEGDQ